MRGALRWVPLLGLLAIAAIALALLVRPADRTHRSALVGKPFPAITLPNAASSRPGFGPAKGARLVNIFASWCAPCAVEAPLLMQLQARGATIDAIAVRDRTADVDRFLEQNGNPFRQIGLDTESRVQLALGSAGVPETFVVDARGTIRAQHVGPVTDDDVPTLLAALKDAR